ncbi:MAG: polysaccharide biosynthesis protein [Rhodopirellula sp.]|nr:polysaccharide biosynthesis protein [Rhodopirellula sp.]
MKYKLKINLMACWGNHLVGILIGLFLMPYVLTTVGDEQYGLWLFICSFAGYSGLLNLGFGDTVSRFVAHHHAKNEITRINQVVSVVGAIYLAMTIFIIGLAGLLAWLAPSLYDWGDASITEIRWVIVLLGANVAIGMLGSVFGGVIIGLQRIDIERGFQTLSGLARLGMTVLLLQTEYALVTLAVIFLLTTLIENVGYLTVVFRQMPNLRIGRRFLNRETFHECFGFSMFALLENLAGKLIDATDTIVIGIMLGTRYIIPYFVAHRLMTFIVQPLQLIGGILMPRGAELGANDHDNSLRVLVQKGLGISFLLTGGFFIGAWFFGGIVLETWVGRSYEHSHSILLILLGAQVIATPLHVLRGVLFGMGHIKVPAILYAIEAVANLVLTLILLKPLGLIGVALGTAIPVILVELCILLPYALSILHFRKTHFFQGVVIPQVLPLAALWGYSFAVTVTFVVSPSWIPVLIVAAGGGVVLGASWLASRHATKNWLPA